MPKIFSVGLGIPENIIPQKDAMLFAKKLFSSGFRDIERLLPVFQNAEIESRYFVKNIDWYGEEHSFAEKNSLFIEMAEKLGIAAIENCLHNKGIDYQEIEAIFTICTTGLATPSLEARIMNKLPFRWDVKRIPIWGLGCVGGAAGLSRAFEYCLAFPKAKILLLSIELCSLTFQKNDLTKSNLIGSSLFADGAACTLLVGDEADVQLPTVSSLPSIIGTQSILFKDSLDVMGWDIKNDGLHVIFSKDIPMIVRKWLQPKVQEFLAGYQLKVENIQHLIAHPGGKKVIDAYVQALGLEEELTNDTRFVLKKYGNMSSVTIFYVLKRILEREIQSQEWGLAMALGPGFSSEQLLLRWD